MARLEQLIEQIRKDRDVRQNLIEIRQNISDESLRRQFMNQVRGDYGLFLELLEHEDPKVRRNAALILGMTRDENVLPALFEAWEAEETLFVREDYLKAAESMDYRDYLPRLNERIHELEDRMSGTSEDAGSDAEKDSEQRGTETKSRDAEKSGSGDAGDRHGSDAENYGSEDAGDRQTEQKSSLWDNDKHLLAELSRLRHMTARYEKHRRHHFIKMNPAPEILLRTNVLHVGATAGQIRSGTVHAMRGGVHVKGGDLHEILKVRTWNECLMPIPGARPVSGDEKMIASRLRDLKIGNYLSYLHEDNGQSFRYRIELKSPSVPREKRGEYIRRIASRLDVLEKGKLLNSESDYEVELRLIERGDHSLIPMLKLFTLPDTRFAYRKETTAQSTSAVLSALAVYLASPYIKDGAQVLDPFCGAGTLLIERCIFRKADPVYGVDRYAEAVEKARINTENAREADTGATSGIPPIHYINRDFFDFTHDYPFDEIITSLPDPQEEDGAHFAERFLRKASTILRDTAVLIILADNPAALKEAAGRVEGYTLLEEHLLNERSGCSEIILGYNS